MQPSSTIVIMSSSSKVSKLAAKDSFTLLTDDEHLKLGKDLPMPTSIEECIELFNNFPIATASFINITGGDNLRLQKENEEIKEYGQAIIAELEANKQVMEGLKTALAAAKLSGQSQDKTAKSEKMPDPAVFDGAKEKLNDFITDMRIKLNVNADRYTSEEQRFGYVVFRTSGEAKDQLRPYYNPESEAMISDQALKILEAAFRDPDRKGTAQRTLTALR
jgi:hypothetical protein